MVCIDRSEVQIIDWREGRVMGTLKDMVEPMGVVMDGEGRVIVADCDADQVHIY